MARDLWGQPCRLQSFQLSHATRLPLQFADFGIQRVKVGPLEMITD
jgi:hypothetical protein